MRLNALSGKAFSTISIFNLSQRLSSCDALKIFYVHIFVDRNSFTFSCSVRFAPSNFLNFPLIVAFTLDVIYFPCCLIPSDSLMFLFCLTLPAVLINFFMSLFPGYLLFINAIFRFYQDIKILLHIMYFDHCKVSLTCYTVDIQYNVTQKEHFDFPTRTKLDISYQLW